MPNARNLTSFSGSKKSKMEPRVRLVCGASESSSKPVEGTNPDWNYTGSLTIDFKKKDNPSLLVVVETEGKFLGQFEANLIGLTKNPQVWKYNGYYDLTEKTENLQKGQTKQSLGRVYIQMKWVPADENKGDQFPAYISDFKVLNSDS